MTVIEDLLRRLKAVTEESDRRGRELSALMNSSRAVLEQKSFRDTARTIFDYCKDLIGATSGYVALLSDDGEENEVLFLESGGLTCSVDEDLPMPIRGLRAESYKNKKAVFDNDFMNSEWIRFMPEGHVVLKNVMFAPLILNDKAVGLIGLANKAEDFNDQDAQMAASFGELAAIALQNSRHLDERERIGREREFLIEELRKSLAVVKQLSGMLPICAHCKKIRDDKGYWEQIEVYIRNHSEAEFSHGLCPECAKEFYPEYVVKRSSED